MIVAIGLDVDRTFPAFVAAALHLGVPVETLNLRAAVTGEWRIPLPPDEPAEFCYAGRTTKLKPSDAYFCRIIDMSSQQPDLAGSRRWLALTRALAIWLDQIPGRVANRSRAGAHNSAKPLHEAILSRHGFRVPDSITSCDLDSLRAFVEQGPAISKAISGVRADTAIATPDLLDLADPAGGPIHLQRRVEGDDARIHVVGDQLVAQRVPSSNGVDYRRDGLFDELKVFDPPSQVRADLIRASAALGLPFAGWDFRIGPDGEYWCLEVNPMPGYSPYDARCEGAISRMLLGYLAAKVI